MGAFRGHERCAREGSVCIGKLHFRVLIMVSRHGMDEWGNTRKMDVNRQLEVDYDVR